MADTKDIVPELYEQITKAYKSNLKKNQTVKACKKNLKKRYSRKLKEEIKNIATNFALWHDRN